MNLLALDTSTDITSIAIQRGDGAAVQVFTHSGPGGAAASTHLIPAIEALMQQAGLGFAQLDAIAFGAGPGSFTGLRTACSVAQGLAFGAGVPVLPVDTLLAVAEEARFQSVQAAVMSSIATSTATSTATGTATALATANADCNSPQPESSKTVKVFAMLDARMNELYACCYEYNSCTWFKHGNMGLIRPENLLLNDVTGLAHDPACLVAGNVFNAYADSLPGSAHRRVHALPTATAMLRLAPALLAAGGAVNAEQALPVYIRDKIAETTQERLQKRLGSPSGPKAVA